MRATELRLSTRSPLLHTPSPHEAQSLGFELMVGNMCGTSLGMAPAFLVAQRLGCSEELVIERLHHLLSQGYLSRLLRGLKDGSVPIVVGTHAHRVTIPMDLVNQH